MRYISAPQRSHGTLSSGASVDSFNGVSALLTGVMGLAGGRGGVCSDMGGIIARTPESLGWPTTRKADT